MQGNIFIQTRQEHYTKKQKKKSTVFSPHRECCRIIIINYIEDTTWWQEDMNVIFKWHNSIYKRAQRISSSHCVMFFFLYRQKDIDKIKEGNYRNHVIDKLMCEIMENKPLRSRV